jgi:hypothetical protein
LAARFRFVAGLLSYQPHPDLSQTICFLDALLLLLKILVVEALVEEI